MDWLQEIADDAQEQETFVGEVGPCTCTHVSENLFQFKIHMKGLPETNIYEFKKSGSIDVYIFDVFVYDVLLW